MQTNSSHRRRKAIAVQVILLVAAFAAGWCFPAWLGFNFAKNTTIGGRATVKNPATKLAQAQTNLAGILRTAAGNSRERNLLSLAAGLDAKTLQSLLFDLTKHSTDGENGKIISILLARLVGLAPSAALDFLKSLHNPEMRDRFAISTFDAWSAKDPQAALAAVSQLPADDVRYVVRERVLQNLIAQDASAALAVLRNQPGGQGSFIYKYVFSEWANQDPSAAAAAALKLPPSQAQDQALQGAANTWAEQDPATALAWANALPAGQQKTDAVNSVITAMSQQDPTAAAAYVLQLPNSQNRDNLIVNGVATQWAQTDPSGLLTWADQNLTGWAFDHTAQMALTQMSQTDPAAAAAALAQISDPNVVSQVVPELATDYAGQNVQAAMQWAQSLPTDNIAVRNSAFSNILGIWSDPAGAASYLQQNFATDPSFNTLATQVVNTWVNSDPQAALNWAESLPSGDAQNSAVITALTKFATVDPQAAAAAANQNAMSKLTGLTAAQQTALQNIAAKGSAP